MLYTYHYLTNICATHKPQTRRINHVFSAKTIHAVDKQENLKARMANCNCISRMAAVAVVVVFSAAVAVAVAEASPELLQLSPHSACRICNEICLCRSQGKCQLCSPLGLSAGCEDQDEDNKLHVNSSRWVLAPTRTKPCGIKADENKVSKNVNNINLYIRT